MRNVPVSYTHLPTLSSIFSHNPITFPPPIPPHIITKIRLSFGLSLIHISTDYLPSGSTPWQYVSGSLPTFVSFYKSLGYESFAAVSYTHLDVYKRQVGGFTDFNVVVYGFF